jgi:hypothetical protein
MEFGKLQSLVKLDLCNCFEFRHLFDSGKLSPRNTFFDLLFVLPTSNHAGAHNCNVENLGRLTECSWTARC